MLRTKIFSALLPFGVGTALFIVMWLMEAPAPIAFAAGILADVFVLSHQLLFKMADFAASVGHIASLPELPQTVKNLDSIAREGRRFDNIILERLFSAFCSRVENLSLKRDIRLSPDDFMAIVEHIYEDLGEGDNLIATSLLGGGEYWKDKFSSNYRRYNEEAHTRGAIIERIFILKDETRRDKLREVLSNQSKFSKVFVALLDGGDLADEERRDIFVINGKKNGEIAAEWHFIDDNKTLRAIDLITDPKEIAELRTLLLHIRDHRAQPFKAVEERH
jgi:hypothetical protein